MSAANVFNTDLRRGDCWNLVVTWQPDGATVDLTGYTAEFAINWPRQASGNGIVPAGELESTPVIDATESTVTVDIDATDTLTIPEISSARYQLRVVDTSGCKTTIAVGSLTINQDYIGA